MMKVLTCIMVAVVLICTSCKRSNIGKLWFYTHSIGDFDGSKSTLTPASFLYLKEDSTYTKDFGLFEHGKWLMKDDKLLLTDDSNKTTTIAIKYESDTDLQLVVEHDVTANFEAQPSSFNTDQANPFAFANNKWRILAARKQTEEEIRSRLHNHCQFWVAYFTWAMDNHIDYIDVRSTPTPIKIYGNGFGLKPYEELPKSWKSYFYDREDCKIANNLLYEVFQFHDISWAHTDNKYKMFVGAFQQLQQFLK